MKILITGATGFIGSALCRELAHSYDVVALVRDPDRDRGRFSPAVQIARCDLRRLDGWEVVCAGANAAVHLAGRNIASGRWTDAVKADILNSRVETLNTLLAALRKTQSGPVTVMAASAVGYYGDRGDETLTESSAPGHGFLADVTQAVEHSLGAADIPDVRRLIIRSGIVLDRSGGALPRMLMPFKFYLGGRQGSGAQYISWISLVDEVAAIRFLLERADLSGPFNLTAPQPVTNLQFCCTLARLARKPCWLPAPAFALKAALGSMAEEVFLHSQRALPQRLTAARFQFQHPTLDACLSPADHESSVMDHG